MPLPIYSKYVVEFNESVRKIIGIMEIEEAYGWKRANNLNHLCKDCPILECKSLNLIKEI